MDINVINNDQGKCTFNAIYINSIRNALIVNFVNIPAFSSVGKKGVLPILC